MIGSSLAMALEVAQFLAGLIVAMAVGNGAEFDLDASEYATVVYIQPGYHQFGLALGPFIFAPDPIMGPISAEVVGHEEGHCIQKQRLGPLYLPLVVVTSTVRHGIAVGMVNTGAWTYQQMSTWYRSGFPEAWADRLGGVE